MGAGSRHEDGPSLLEQRRALRRRLAAATASATEVLSLLAADFNSVVEAADRWQKDGGCSRTSRDSAEEEDFQEVLGGPCRYRELHQPFATFAGTAGAWPDSSCAAHSMSAAADALYGVAQCHPVQGGREGSEAEATRKLITAPPCRRDGTRAFSRLRPRPLGGQAGRVAF